MITKYLILFIFLITSTFLFSQQKGTVIDIPFAENKAKIDGKTIKKITSFFEEIDPDRQILYIDLYARSTFTDGLGAKYLGEKRIESVKQLLSTIGIKENKINVNINSNISGNLEEIPRHRKVELTYVPRVRYIKSDLEEALEAEGYDSKGDVSVNLKPGKDLKEHITQRNKIDTFQIHNLRDTTVVNHVGVGLYIPAFSIIGVSERRPDVTLVTKSITKREDLIMENITTATMNGDVLETDGVIHLHAFSPFKESMRINPKRPIVLFLPHHSPSGDMNFYLGISSDENEEILWTRRRTPFFITKNDTIQNALKCYNKNSFNKCAPFCDETKLLKDGKMKDKYAAYFANRESKKKYNDSYDCLEAKAFDYLRTKMQNLGTGNNISPTNFKSGYMFRTNRTGWNNVEKKQKKYFGRSNVVISDDTPDANEDIFIKIILDNMNAVFSNPKKHSSNIFEFKDIPMNANAHIIAIKEVDGKPYVAVESIVTGINTKATLTYRSFRDYEGVQAYLSSKTNPASDQYASEDF